MSHESQTHTKASLWKWLLFGVVVGIAGVLWKLRQVSDWARQATQPADKSEPLTPLAPSRPVSVAPQKIVEERPQPPTPQPDDLRQVKGIGPKIMQLLNENGIFTFEQLADTEIGFLKTLLEKRNWRMADPSSWPEQARILALQKGQ